MISRFCKHALYSYNSKGCILAIFDIFYLSLGRTLDFFIEVNTLVSPTRQFTLPYKEIKCSTKSILLSFLLLQFFSYYYDIFTLFVSTFILYFSHYLF